MLLADLFDDLGKLGAVSWASVAALIVSLLAANRKAILAMWERAQKNKLANITANQERANMERVAQEEIRKALTERYDRWMQEKDTLHASTIAVLTDANDRNIKLLVATGREEQRLERAQCQAQFEQMLARTDNLLRSHDQVIANLEFLAEQLGKKRARRNRSTAVGDATDEDPVD